MDCFAQPQILILDISLYIDIKHQITLKLPIIVYLLIILFTQMNIMETKFAMQHLNIHFQTHLGGHLISIKCYLD